MPDLEKNPDLCLECRECAKEFNDFQSALTHEQEFLHKTSPTYFIQIR